MSYIDEFDSFDEWYEYLQELDPIEFCRETDNLTGEEEEMLIDKILSEL